jgi:hypothetical protein
MMDFIPGKVIRIEHTDLRTLVRIACSVADLISNVLRRRRSPDTWRIETARPNLRHI